jgi:predicted TIM-barrel fold metal-dependent hydrolase
MEKDRVLIMSGDCHAGMRTKHYRDYLESRYHEEFDRYMAETHAALGEILEKSILKDMTEDRVAFATNMDPERRIKELEADGVVGEVIFPDGSGDNEIPFTGSFGRYAGSDAYSRELARAGQTAYNRWLAEFVDPDRQVGLAVVNFNDIDEAVKVVRWAARSGLRGVLLQDGEDPRNPNPQLPHLYHSYFEPLWAALEDEGLPACFHAGCGAPDIYEMGTPQGMAIFITEVFIWPQRPLWWLLLGGVLERHPGLKIVFTEMGSMWIARALAFMDWQWENGVFGDARATPKKPSEYWARQGFVGSSIMTLEEVAARDNIGLANIMFGTDFPHLEGTWGQTLAYLRATFGTQGVSESEARAMLGENMVRCYNMDLYKLKAIAQRVGPTVEEVLSAQSETEIEPRLVKLTTKPSFIF